MLLTYSTLILNVLSASSLFHLPPSAVLLETVSGAIPSEVAS